MIPKNVLALALLLACLSTSALAESISERGTLKSASEEVLEHSILAVQNHFGESAEGSRIDFSAPLNGEKLWLAEQLHNDHGFNHRHHHHHHHPGPPGPVPPPPVTDPGGSGPPDTPPPPPVAELGGSGPLNTPSPASVPEPDSLILFAGGLMSLLTLARASAGGRK